MKFLLPGIVAGCVSLVGPACAVTVCHHFDTPGTSSRVTQITNPADTYFGKYIFDINVWGVGEFCDRQPEKAVTDFFIPYFSDMGIQFPLFGRNQSGAFFGTFAAYDIESDSHFNLGGSELHFVFDTSSGNGVSQFIVFIADFGGTKAPYRSDFLDPNGVRSSILGDPLIPASPQAVAALNAANSVPEPGTLAMAVLGLGLGCFIRGKRKA